MKRLIALFLMISLVFCCSAALAEPTPAPSDTPAGSPAPTATPNNSGLISFGASGETIVRIQLRLRELGYFNYKPTGNFQSMTVEATKRFQQKQTDAAGNPIMADGTIGAQTLSIIFQHSAARADIDASIPIGSGVTEAAAPTGELVDWSEVSGLLVQNVAYKITDLNTGASWSMIFTSGDSHAEMECATAADAAAYMAAFGGAYNYSKRSVLVEIGSRSVAASLQGWPHGEDNVRANDMDGHACLYFNGSLSHVAGLPDVEHQNLVYKAAGRS